MYAGNYSLLLSDAPDDVLPVSALPDVSLLSGCVLS